MGGEGQVSLGCWLSCSVQPVAFRSLLGPEVSVPQQDGEKENVRSLNKLDLHESSLGRKKLEGKYSKEN